MRIAGKEKPALVRRVGGGVFGPGVMVISFQCALMVIHEEGTTVAVCLRVRKIYFDSKAVWGYGGGMTAKLSEHLKGLTHRGTWVERKAVLLAVTLILSGFRILERVGDKQIARLKKSITRVES